MRRDPNRGTVELRGASGYRKRQLSSHRQVLCVGGTSISPKDEMRPAVQLERSGDHVERSCRRTACTSSAHVLFALGDARRAAESDSGAGRSSRSRHDAALHAPESCGARQCDSAARWPWRHRGNGGYRKLWSGESLRRKDQWLQRLTGGEAGIRTLRPRLSNLVMARDFWP